MCFRRGQRRGEAGFSKPGPQWSSTPTFWERLLGDVGGGCFKTLTAMKGAWTLFYSYWSHEGLCERHWHGDSETHWAGLHRILGNEEETGRRGNQALCFSVPLINRHKCIHLHMPVSPHTATTAGFLMCWIFISSICSL